MIRINLLAVERERSKRRTGSLLQATQQKITLACSVILVLAALGIGWWYWSLSKQADRIEADIVTAQRETERLRGLIAQVEQFEARRLQLQQRVALIEELRKGQAGPVRLLDEISRSLPDMLWLTEIKQQGSELTISGRCTTLTALSDFVGNLELGGFFNKPVEILDSQVDSQRGVGGVELIRFSVKAVVSTPAA
ncbi:MAG TPA: PilN domain-containing protein [Vicinamibacterales bacterium]|nr:PilN domain-containing protein [Acidobacteriota bacterium]HOC18088.1 PilN domain-containing protein [Vicinamibacterales bacterium]